METEPDEYHDCFMQDGVLLKQAPSSHMTALNTIGTLYIYEVTRSGESCNKKLLLEWKQNDITVDSDVQYQEWAVVNTVQKRIRTLSENMPEHHNRSKSLKINFEEIKSFKVCNKNRQLTFYDGTSEPICGFLFQHGNCEHLVGILKTILKVGVSRRDKQIYVVYDSNSPEFQELNRSFAALNLKNEDNSFWHMFKHFKENPYEGSLGAFAKVTNFVYRSVDGSDPDILSRDELYSSITELDDGVPHSGGEYEVIEALPQLPRRKEFPRCNPLTEEQWRSQFNSHGQLEDVDLIKNLIFRGGVSPSIRKEVWKFLLDYFPWDSTELDRQQLINKKNEEYYVMKLQWKSISQKQEDNFSDYAQRKCQVIKDVNRTDRTLEFYAGDNNINIQTLGDILMTYVMYNFDLGYVQGMSDLLSPILWLMQDENDSFWCFVGFMEKVMSNFDIDQAGMKEQLTQLRVLLSFIDPVLASYLEKHDCGNMFFCFRWLLVWFKRELNQDDILRFWEVLWTGYPCHNFHLLVSVAILEHESEALMENDNGFTEILKYINELSGKLDMALMLNKAEGIYNQIKEADHLTDSVRSILGLPLIGTKNRGSEEQSSQQESPFESPDLSTPRTEPCCSVDNVRISPDEIAFEKSISSSFL